MQWADIIAPPSRTTLRQFAGLWIVFLTGLGAWRMWQGTIDGWAWALVGLAVGLGVPGLIRPAVMRPIFTGWMVAVFPIGWTVSRVVLALLFYGVFTPVALVFRATGRDVLRRRRRPGASYWMPKTTASRSQDYLRQF